MSVPLYQLQHLTMAYNGRVVLSLDQLSLEAGELISIVGPNGAGKSTLLGIMAGLRQGYRGSCQLQGLELRRWARRAFARLVSYVPQGVQIQFPFTAEQVVLMGRTPYCDGLFEAPSDWEVVEWAMEITDTIEFRKRDFRSLSGGEQQRVVLAAALAQKPKVLLLDEPTAFLDVKHQVAIQRLLCQLARQGLLVVTATHDLNLALAYSDRVLVLCRGQLVAEGPPAQALTPVTIRTVFEVTAEVETAPCGTAYIHYAH